MAGLIRGVHHVSIKFEGAEAFERGISFYRDVLGMPVVRTWGEGAQSGAMLFTGSGLMELGANAEDAREQGAIRHFALATDDADACVRAVSEAGYAVTVAPKDIVLPSDPPFPARIAFCVGPAGEEIEFFQEK